VFISDLLRSQVAHALEQVRKKIENEADLEVVAKSQETLFAVINRSCRHNSNTESITSATTVVIAEAQAALSSSSDTRGRRSSESHHASGARRTSADLLFGRYGLGKRVRHLFRGAGKVVDHSATLITVRFDVDQSTHRYNPDQIAAGKLTLEGAIDIADFHDQQRVFHWTHGEGTVQAVRQNSISAEQEVVIKFDQSDEAVAYTNAGLSTGKIRILDAERYGSVDYTQTGFFADLQAQIDELQLQLNHQDILRADWDFETGKYAPKPLDLDNVLTPKSVGTIIDQLSSTVTVTDWHHYCDGSTTDNSQTEIFAERRIEAAWNIVKIVYACGYELSEGPSPPSGAEFNEELRGMKLLIDIMTFDRHERWAQVQQNRGISYGRSPVASDKQHPHFLPFHILDIELIDEKRLSTKSSIVSVLKAGFKIKKTEKKMRAADLLSPRAVEKWRIPDDKLVQLKEQQDEAELLMERMLGTEVDKDLVTIDRASGKIGGLVVRTPRGGRRRGSNFSIGVGAKFASFKRKDLDKSKASWAKLKEAVSHKDLIRQLGGQISKPQSLSDVVVHKKVMQRNLTSRADMRHVRSETDTATSFRIYAHLLSQPIRPSNRNFQVWSVFVMLAVLFSSLVVPLRLAFNVSIEVGGAFYCWEALLEVVFIVDILLSFRVAYYHAGALVQSPKEIAIKYLTGWFVPDALGSVPAEIIRGSFGSGQGNLSTLKMLRLLKLLRLVRLIKVDQLTDQLNGRIRPSTVTLCKLIFVFVLVLHLQACAYWAIADQIGFNGEDRSDRWVPHSSYADPHLSWVDKYLVALHYSILAFVGSDTPPTTRDEYLFQCISLAIGIILSSAIIGSTTTILASMDKMAEEKRGHMDKMSGYMKTQHIPVKLQDSIYQYYLFLWKSNWAANRVDLFPNLPPLLNLQLELSLKQKLIKKCELFTSCQPKSTMHLVRRLKPSMAIPDEVLFRENEIGKQLFFLVHGELSKYTYITGNEGQVQARVIQGYANGGDTLGELAFFETNNRYALSAMATTFCEVETLGFKDLAELASMYVDIAVQIEKSAKNHSRLRHGEGANQNGFSYSWTTESPSAKSRRILLEDDEQGTARYGSRGVKVSRKFIAGRQKVAPMNSFKSILAQARDEHSMQQQESRQVHSGKLEGSISN